MSRPGRALGLDLGSRRVGVALSDAGRAVATPLETIERGKKAAQYRRRVAELVEEWEITVVVVGLPLSLSGAVGPAAAAAQAEIDALRVTLSVPVETYDERLTTVTANRSLHAQGVRGPKRRQMIDQLAAAVLLQGWLDATSRGST